MTEGGIKGRVPEDPHLETGTLCRKGTQGQSRRRGRTRRATETSVLGREGRHRQGLSTTRRPQVFSIAVFGPIVNEGYVNSENGPELRCVFNGNAGACRFGITLGLGAFLACAAFLLLDLRFQQISSVRDRRRAVLLDLGFSGGCGWAERGGPGTGAPRTPRGRGRGRASRFSGGWDWNWAGLGFPAPAACTLRG